MPLPNAGGQQFADANKNGYPDNFEAEEIALMEQIAQRKKMFGVTETGKPTKRPGDKDLTALFGTGTDSLFSPDGHDMMESKSSAFGELFGSSVTYAPIKPKPKPKWKRWKKKW